jgi:chromosome segregation ATPase
MVLLLAFFDEFGSFLKIFLWIALPLIIVSLLVTTIFHYSQKKKNALKGEENPELPVHETVDISLVSRLQKEVLHYKRRIKELQHALTFAKEVIPPESLKTRINSLHDEVSALIINQVPQVDLQTGTDSVVVGDPGVFQGGAVSENAALSGNQASADTDFSTSAAYLHDLVNEQKTHVLFLQQQLETRIKAFHDLEFQFRENAALLEKMTMSYEHMKHQLDDGEAAASMLRIEKDSMQAQISRLENSLRELQDQHNKSLKMLDKNPVNANDKPVNTIDESANAVEKTANGVDKTVNAIDKSNDATNGKHLISMTAETELAETGHS